MKRNRMSGICMGVSAGVLFLVVGAGTSMADNRLFSYVYEPGFSEQGVYEFEQHVTARIGKDDGQYTGWDFREEVEYGLTDRLKTALYLNFSQVDSSGVTERVDEDGTEFKGVSSEWIYRVLDPLEHAVGVSVYGEVTMSDEETEIEEKLILGQYWGPWGAALNVALEEEWEKADGETETEGVLDVSGGVARYVGKKTSIGVEARNIRRYPDYEREENSAWFVGPNAHYKGVGWGAVLSVLTQVYGDGDGATDNLQLTEYEQTEVRLIASRDF